MISRIAALNKSAASAQRRGLKKVFALRRHYSEATAPASSSATDTRDTEGKAGPEGAPLSEAEQAALEAELIKQDKSVIKAELERYEAAGIVEVDDGLDTSRASSLAGSPLCTDDGGSTSEEWEDEEDFDLLRFWRDHKKDFPALYRVALDILPVPASSVPCERVFSSCKDTDTVRRNALDDAMLEILQVLKFSLKQERLEFPLSWRPTLESELLGLQEAPSEATRMIAEGRLDDFMKLVMQSQPVLE
ncbi:hypothetical protein BN946_scf184621.g1 [Trametes cinnabarina]|uniref:HAT C-terminal dimerisation domain-containing protein n=1 Tax=Pycnoporus cinnabarinus TaxID=5643 RepID=A0A060T0B5_PYCCI|nr:hypothetical protein BN946_scf184621.g1 [Trametes cinnabarina]